MLVGIHGLKGSGKTTIAKYLQEKYHFIEKPFADPLKEICKVLFLLDDDQLYGTLEQKEQPDPRWFGCSPRKMFQYVGTELFRNQLDQIMPGLGEDVFIHHFKLQFPKYQKLNVIISDVRFQNEINMIHELGGIVIKIQTENVLVHTHSSEKDQYNTRNCDYVVYNNSTKDELFQHIDFILQKEFNIAAP